MSDRARPELETTRPTEDVSPDETQEPQRHRVADGVRTVELASYQQTVRSLLVEPFVRPSQTERLAAVRRWEHELRTDFETQLRYRLEVGGTSARLIKRPTRLSATLGTVTRTGRPFDHRRYAYTCLMLATLLRAGPQILLSDLADRLRSDAAGIDGLDFETDVYPQRTAFIDAVRWLESVEALVLRDGTTDIAVGAEALYDVNDEVVHLLVPSLGLRDLGSIEDRFGDTPGQGRYDRRLRNRRTVLRRLLEEPAVLLADLSDDEAGWLRRAAKVLVEDAERLTGLEVERRSEGVALIDTVGDASDRVFPGPGSASQLALLLGDRLTGQTAPTVENAGFRGHEHSRLASLIDKARAEAGSNPDPGAPRSMSQGGDPQPAQSDGRAAHGIEEGPIARESWTMRELEDIIAEIIAANPGVRRDLRDDPVAATRAALDELLAFDLITTETTSKGETLVSLAAPIWRYRSDHTEGTDNTKPQLDLFGAPS